MKLELLTSDEQRKLCKAFEALQADATVLETEIQQLQEAHEKTIEAIASAHESRRTAVRTGNEALRLEAMEQIRTSEAKRAELEDTLATGFSDRLLGLKEQRKALFQQILPLRQQAEAQLKLARQAEEAVELLRGFGQVVLQSLNSVEALVKNAKPVPELPPCRPSTAGA